MSDAPRPEDFGESGKLALGHAQRISAELGGGSIRSGHLFLGVVALEDVVIRRRFTAAAIDLEAVARQVRAELASQAGGGGPLFDEGAVRVLMEAQREASAQAKALIEAPHILIALITDRDGLVARKLDEAGANREQLHKELAAMLDQGQWSGDSYQARRAIQQPGIGTPGEVLESLGRDLTADAEAGKLSAVIGREREILEVVHVLSGKRKNNAALIGDAGVGKTAIVEGLAQRIVAGEIHEQLKGMRVRTIEVGSLVAGTMYRGQFEGKLKALIDEARDRDDLILFIDEMHMLIGAGSAEGVPTDAADMLKPVLTEGSLKVIGATTTDEFRTHIESDPALMRRFQPVLVREPTPEAAMQIMQGVQPRYEEFHGVKILPEALAAAVDLSVRHMHGRHLPDKALDLLDRACTQEKLGTTLRDWMPALAPDESEGEADRTDLVVGAREVKEVVSILLEIPIADLTPDEKKHLARMEDALRRTVVGQDEAVKAVADAILAERVTRDKMEMRQDRRAAERPYGVFLFLGPTGVGKTKLAEEVAAFLFGDKRELVRLDMSEYMESHAISRLLGAPPGYRDFERGGTLTNAVRAKPYSVVLLDEIEKAHPDLWTVFLQVFEDGRLTDHAERLVDFTNTVVIMTSNVGARRIQASRPIGFVAEEAGREAPSRDEIEREVRGEVARVFPPEFINRVDQVLVFNAISREALAEIVDRLVREMLPVDVVLSEDARELLVEQSYDPAMGARPVRRAIQLLLRNPIAAMLVNDEIDPDDTVAVDVEDGKLTLASAKVPSG